MRLVSPRLLPLAPGKGSAVNKSSWCQLLDQLSSAALLTARREDSDGVKESGSPRYFAGAVSQLCCLHGGKALPSRGGLIYLPSAAASPLG